MAKKQPYIPVYMGDDMRECGHLTPEVYGGYCRLRFALWDRQDRGRMVYDISSFKRIMGADSVQQAETIIQTLVNEGVLKTQEGTGVRYLVRAEMVEAHRISLLRKETGSKGGKKSQQTRNQKNNSASTFAVANNQPKSEAKREQNTEIETDNEYDNENSGVGGLGEEGDENSNPKTQTPKPEDEPDNHQSSIPNQQYFSEYTEYTVEQCLEHYKTSGYEMARNTLAQLWKISPDTVLRWAEIFTTVLKSRNQPDKTMADYTQHFASWLKLKADKTNPEKYIEHATTTNNGKALSATNTGGGTNATAVIPAGRSFRNTTGN